MPESTTVADIDLLIGSEHYGNIVHGAPQTMPSGLHLLPSRLGHIVTGRPSRNTFPTSAPEIPSLMAITQTNMTTNLPLYSYLTQADQALVSLSEPNMTEFWTLERIGVEDPASHPPSDLQAIQQFESTVTFHDQRYSVGWPWKPGNHVLPSNRELAYGRMRSLSKRLAADHNLLERFNEVIQNQVTQGIIERVSPTSVTGPRLHYLPHHPVLTPAKTTPKLRVVYDASAKSRKDLPCLNECLLQGPVLLPSLCGILLRFRLAPIIVLGDIEKAFLQVAIQPTDRDVTRFFWYDCWQEPNNIDGNLHEYRFCRLPFGVISSPFLLDATIRHHLQRYDTATAKAIADNIYVDNVMLTAATREEATTRCTDAIDIFHDASMKVREWVTNSSTARAALLDDLRAVGTNQKVLGLRWDIKSDCISIPAATGDFQDTTNWTKRKILHYIARIYDPLGLFMPVTFHGKVLLRHLWSLQLGWDEPLPASIADEWHATANVLQLISNVQTPRLVRPASTPTASSLHVFCDASQHSYATSVYLRSDTSHQPLCHLVFAKMRLTPAKAKLKRTDPDDKTVSGFTLPRLELLAALMAVRAAKFVRDQLQMSLLTTTIWSVFAMCSTLAEDHERACYVCPQQDKRDSERT